MDQLYDIKHLVAIWKEDLEHKREVLKVCTDESQQIALKARISAIEECVSDVSSIIY